MLIILLLRMMVGAVLLFSLKQRRLVLNAFHVSSVVSIKLSLSWLFTHYKMPLYKFETAREGGFSEPEGLVMLV